MSNEKLEPKRQPDLKAGEHDKNPVKGADQRPAQEGPLPEGNGSTGKPAAFPPHN